MPKSQKVVALARKYRAEQIDENNAILIEMLDDWQKIATQLRGELKDVTTKISQTTDATKSPSATLLYQKARIEKLIDDATAQMNKYGGDVKQGIQQRQPEIVAQAASDAQSLTIAAGASASISDSWAHIDPEHIETLADRLKPGGLVDQALQKIAPTAADKLRDAILTRVGTGEQPESVAKDFEAALGTASAQFLTIARTEDMNAYRRSQIASFRANRKIYTGWRWMASLDPTTCAACLAMNGQVFSLDEDMDSHFNCRCVCLPITKSFDPQPMQSGEDWLKQQPEDTQRKVLGPTRYDLWREGKVSLQDMVTHSHSDLIGGMYHEATVEQTLANAEKSGGGEVLSSTDPRISDFVDNRIQGDLGKQVDEGLQAIESVHKPISQNKIPIQREETKSEDGKIQAGAYYFNKTTRKPLRIGINPDGPHIEMTIAHEYGHDLHMGLFSENLNERGYSSFETSELRELGEAINNSDSVTQLGEYANNGGSFNNGRFEILSGKEPDLVRYYLYEEELFARAYAQYIATRSGDKTMLIQLGNMRNGTTFRRNRQWDGDEFAPIATEFDKLFKKKGLQ